MQVVPIQFTTTASILSSPPNVLEAD